MNQNEHTYVVILDRAKNNYYATELEGGETLKSAARRLVVYHELPGPNQFQCYSASACDSGQAITRVRRGVHPEITITDVNGEKETFTSRKWCYIGMLYFNGPSN